jgi:hypothetical protein
VATLHERQAIARLRTLEALEQRGGPRAGGIDERAGADRFGRAALVRDLRLPQALGALSTLAFKG